MAIGPIVQVLIGLIFVYFLFSLVCSGINEYISRQLHKRSLFLSHGVWQLLDNNDAHFFQKFWKHALVRQLGQPLKAPKPAKGIAKAVAALFTREGARAAAEETKAKFPDDHSLRQSPSYIPTSTFVTVITALLSDRPDPPTIQETSPFGKSIAVLKQDAGLAPDQPPGEEVNAARQALADATATAASQTGADGSGAAAVAGAMEKAVKAAEDRLDTFKKNLGRWYDDEMDRVSGWYKRESKTVLFILSVAVVFLLNIDTVAVARELWTNSDERKIVADAAQAQLDAVGQPTVPGPTPTTLPALALACPGATTTTSSAPASDGKPTTTSTTTPADVAAIKSALDCAGSLKLPIGWRVSNSCSVGASSATEPCRGFWSHVGGIVWSIRWHPIGALLKLVGLFITAGALSFGAPFWFDMLNRVANLRSAGVKPPPASSAPSTPS